MEGRKLWMYVKESIKCRVGIANNLLALGLQVLIDESCAACPKWGCCAGASNADPAGGGTSRIGYCAIHSIASRRIGVSSNVGYLTKAVTIWVLYTGASLPARLLKGIAETSASSGALGAAGGAIRV